MDSETVVYAHIHFKLVHTAKFVKFVKNKEYRHFEFPGVRVGFPSREFS